MTDTGHPSSGAGLVTEVPAQDDVELLARLPGDEQALEALHRRHAEAAQRVALRLLGDAAAAADVVQEAFVQVWTGGPAYRGHGSVRAWIVGIVVNLARMHRRSEGARWRRGQRWGAAQGGAEASVPQLLEREETGAIVRRELAALPERYRQPLLLRYAEGMSTAAVAQALGRRPETVRSQIRRGLGRLRERLHRIGAALGLLALLRAIGDDRGLAAAGPPPEPVLPDPASRPAWLEPRSPLPGRPLPLPIPAPLFTLLAVVLVFGLMAVLAGAFVDPMAEAAAAAEDEPPDWVAAVGELPSGDSGDSGDVGDMHEIGGQLETPTWIMGPSGPEIVLLAPAGAGPQVLLWRQDLAPGTWRISYQVRRYGGTPGSVTGPTLIRPAGSTAGAADIRAQESWTAGRDWQMFAARLVIDEAAQRSTISWQVDGTRVLDMTLPFAAPHLALAAVQDGAIEIRDLRVRPVPESVAPEF